VIIVLIFLNKWAVLLPPTRFITINQSRNHDKWSAIDRQVIPSLGRNKEKTQGNYCYDIREVFMTSHIS
jgi:hypothetical protein